MIGELKLLFDNSYFLVSSNFILLLNHGVEVHPTPLLHPAPPPVGVGGCFYLSKYLFKLFHECCKKLEIAICHNHGVGVHPTPLLHPVHPTHWAGVGFYFSKYHF